MNIVASLRRAGLTIVGRTLDLTSFQEVKLPEGGVTVEASEPYDDSELAAKVTAIADELGQLKETVALLLDAAVETSDTPSETTEEPDTQEPSTDETE